MATINAKEFELGKKMKELAQLSKEAYEEKEEGSDTLKSINTLHAKIHGDHKVNSNSRNKLKTLYNQGLKDTEKQQEAFKIVLDKIKEIRKLEDEIKCLRGPAVLRRGVLMNLLQENAKSLPVWIGKPGEKAPPLCGGVPPSDDLVCEVGWRVAALVTEPDETEGQSWILAEVVSYQSSQTRYEVDDVDAEEGKERYVLNQKKVIPLPLWKANPVINPEAIFPIRQLVLALYPQTTCFYRALVEDTPKHVHDEYSLFFEDPSYPEGYAPPLKIPQKYVIECREDQNKK